MPVDPTLDASVFRTVEARYGRMTVFANDIGAATLSLMTYGEWAENEISFVRTFIPLDGTVVDVGAYIGTHALAFSRFVGPKGAVIALEAQPDTFAVLRQNLAVNGSLNVHAENCAACDRSGTLTIPLIDISHRDSFGSASLRTSVFYESACSMEAIPPTVGRTAQVRAITIDEFELPKCSLIKVDAEGLEDVVFRGAAETIRRTSPAVYAECNSVADGLRCIDVLKNYGYQVRLHVVNAFNSDNFLGVSNNIFGRGSEAALVGLSVEGAHHFNSIVLRPCESLLRIDTADDLVLGMLNKPQYIDEVLQQSSAAQSGGDSWLKEIRSLHIEMQRVLNEVSRIQDALDAANEQVRKSSVEAEEAKALADASMLQARLAREFSDRAGAEALEARRREAEAEETLRKIHTSRSWRWTAPLRAVIQIIRGGR